MAPKIGILGGTFDPVHNGHLAIARAARCACSLDRVLFVPSSRPPHKRYEGMAPGRIRAKMVELALDSECGFELSRIELDRPGISYTVETLRQFRQEWEKDPLFLIIGGDNAQEMDTWLEPDEVLELATVLVVQRTGSGRDQVPRTLVDRMEFLETPIIDISSTEIRNRARERQSLDGLVPAPVARMIRDKNLYTPERHL
jgi:nicotinate-nucleotide adenylyltransferase